MVDVRIVHTHDFIKTTPVGALDFESSKNLLFEMARQQTGDCCHMLLDIRHTTANISYKEIYELVKAMKEEEGLFQQKIALLDNYDDAFEQAQFFEASAQHVGLQVKAFIDFEEAFRWLYPETTTLNAEHKTQTENRET